MNGAMFSSKTDLWETPQVEALKVSSMGKAVAEITEFDGITIARLKELDRAEKAGRLEDKPQWISVKDRLPDSDGSYVVHSKKSGKVFTAHCTEERRTPLEQSKI